MLEEKSTSTHETLTADNVVELYESGDAETASLLGSCKAFFQDECGLPPTQMPESNPTDVLEKFQLCCRSGGHQANTCASVKMELSSTHKQVTNNLCQELRELFSVHLTWGKDHAAEGEPGLLSVQESDVKHDALDESVLQKHKHKVSARSR